MDQLEANKHDDQATSAQLRPATGLSARGIHEHTVETSQSRSKKGASFQHKAFPFVVVSPVGRPLFEVDNTLHLLEILQDAIKGHRSLYQDGGILHQDISPINIIITSATKGGDPKGMLIDLGMATKGPPPDNQATGTDQFMAIGVCAAYLPCNPHTYRHDLESFLLVFLFVAICPRHATRLPPASRLLQWTQGTMYEQVQKKTSDMGKQQFACITQEFSPDFKGLEGLAENLREVLFPMRAGQLWTGTDTGSEAVDALYDGVINVFDRAIASASKLEVLS